MPRLAGGLVALLFLSPGVRAGVLYQTNLASLADGPARLEGWELTEGQYAVADGWLTVTSDRSNPAALLRLAHDGDFTFRGTIRAARYSHWSALLARGVYRLEVNNQFVHVALLKLVGTEWKQLATAPGYRRYVAHPEAFELRLVARGSRVMGFLDQRMVVAYTDPDPVPPGGRYGLLGGYGSKVAWRDISLSDQPDERAWPREALPEPSGGKLVEVTRVRGRRDQRPDENLYTDGEEAGLRVSLRSKRDQPARVNLRFRLIDVRQKQVGARTREVELEPGIEQAVTVTFAPRARGCFKVALDAGLSPTDLQWVEDLGSFTVVSPALDTRPRGPNSFFGGHMDGIYLAWHLRMGRRLGMQWARCHDMMQWTWWDRIQPDGPEQWEWRDDYQKLVDDAGFRTSGEFLRVPPWAQQAGPQVTGEPHTYPPKSRDDLARYVHETVAHYRGSIHHWEVWNEPHFSGFFSGTPEQYAEIMQVAYREAKRADPTCVVIGGGGVNFICMDWIRQMLRAAGGRHMDAFSIHYLDPVTGAQGLRELRAMLDQVGFRGPVWNTEECVESSSFLDQGRADFAEPEAPYHFRNACYELVRVYMENLAGGVRRVFYYDLADPWRMATFAKPRVFPESPITGSLWDEGSMLKPVAAAHAAMALAIDGKPFRRRLTRDLREVFLFASPDGKQVVAVQYALYPTYAQRSQLRLRLPAGARASSFRVMDFLGNERTPTGQSGTLTLPLSREPIYLSYTGPRAEEVLAGMYR